MSQIAVLGSRHFADRALLFRVLADHAGAPSLILSGGAPGADALGAAWASSVNVPIQVFAADWRGAGRSAGLRRSAELLASLPAGSSVFVFVRGLLPDSPGSAFSVRRARALRLPVCLVVGGVVRWLFPPSTSELF